MQALRSVRARLTLWSVPLLALILAAFSAGIYLTLRHNLSANLDDSLETRTNILLDVVHFEGGRPTLAGRVSSGEREGEEEFVRVFDAEGAVTFDGGGQLSDIPVDSAGAAGALPGRP